MMKKATFDKWQWRRLTPEQDAELAMLMLAEQYEAAQNCFHSFVQLVNDKYQMEWFHEILCDEITDWINGVNPYLIICMPPRHGKSELTSRLLPAFLFGQNKDEQVVVSSYSPELSASFNRDIQKYMAGVPYRSIFPDLKVAAPSRENPAVNNSSRFQLEKANGVLHSVGIGTALTGFGANRLIVDDFHKDFEDSRSKTSRERVWNWFNTVAMTRLQSLGEQKQGALVTVTRWHEDDLVGRLMKTKEFPWRVVVFPAEAYAHNHPQRHEKDQREPGEALWPERMSKEKIGQMSRQMGAQVAAGPLQQDPKTAGGFIFKREKFNFFHTFPQEFSHVFSTADLAFKDGQNTDYNAALVFGTKVKVDDYGRPLRDVNGFQILDIYVLDCFHARLDFAQLTTELQQFWNKHPLAFQKIIEDKANGSAVISLMSPANPGIEPWTFSRDKTARGNLTSHHVELGRVYLPSESIAPWVTLLLDELCGFPNVEKDDLYDAFCMGLLVINDRQKEVNRFGGYE